GVPVERATHYLLSVWVKGNGALRVRVGLHNSRGHALKDASLRGSGVRFHPRRSRWTRYTVRFRTPARAASIVFQIGGRHRQNATFLVDSVSLSHVVREVLSNGKKPPAKEPHPTPTTTPTTTTATTT